MLKISSDWHIKYAYFINGWLVQKSREQYFKENFALSVGFIMKPKQISVFSCWDKNQFNFAGKFVERNNHKFPDKSPCLNICSLKVFFDSVKTSSRTENYAWF